MAKTEIASLGEFGLIKELTKDIKPVQPSTIKGVGDDCAVIKAYSQPLPKGKGEQPLT